MLGGVGVAAALTLPTEEHFRFYFLWACSMPPPLGGLPGSPHEQGSSLLRDATPHHAVCGHCVPSCPRASAVPSWGIWFWVCELWGGQRLGQLYVLSTQVLSKCLLN